jgi:cytochrome c oxidase cbb3-type subunit III
MTRIFLVVIGLALAAVPSRAQTIDTGKREFQARCASCHGDDGTGGVRGFNIVNIRQPRATSKDAVRDLIRRGIPNAGMPAFSLS